MIRFSLLIFVVCIFGGTMSCTITQNGAAHAPQNEERQEMAAKEDASESSMTSVTVVPKISERAAHKSDAHKEESQESGTNEQSDGLSKANVDVDVDVDVDVEADVEKRKALKMKGANLHVQISVRDPAVQKSILLTFELNNRSEQSVEVCKYQTPLEKMVSSARMFEVIDDKGNAVKYTGPMIKRPEPSRANGDYLTVEPGKSVTANVNLAKSYNFEPGKYRIKFIGNRSLNSLPSSNEIQIEVSE